MRRTLMPTTVCLCLLAISLIWNGSSSAIAEREPNRDELHTHRENLHREYEKLGQREHELEKHLDNLEQEAKKAEQELEELGKFASGLNKRSKKFRMPSNIMNAAKKRERNLAVN